MLAYCSAIWRCRYFWLSLVKLDLRSRYRGSLLGLGWSLAHPLAMTAIFFGIFCKLFDQSPAYYTVNGDLLGPVMRIALRRLRRITVIRG